MSTLGRLHLTAMQLLRSPPLPRTFIGPIVDHMIARYFNAQGSTRAKFLRGYESFWEGPTATSFAWLGLLFSIMCLSTQLLHLDQGPGDPADIMDVHWVRERTVHCLVLGNFTRGGPHILEIMTNHIASEVFLCKDAGIGLWMLLGIIVQLALSQGHHRDPRNFPHISLFDGEMRRRVWASVVQMDLRISVQMGLPRLIKMQQCDTEEPRNLLDSDFDDAPTMVELPPSRPETEITPVLYRLAKNRIDIAGGLISDLLAETREQPYPEIMSLDQKLQAAEAALPPIFRWQPLNQSFMVAPQVVLHRIWLQLGIQRLIICLHPKYLAPSYAQDRYPYSRNACVQAAIKILQFQQLIDEEIQPGGQLHPVRWMQSSLLQFNFLLGMSVLCYYIQLSKSTAEVQLNNKTKATIYSLLGSTYPLWLRSSAVSQDARKAVEHLSHLSGLRSELRSTPSSHESMDNLAVPQDAPVSIDQITWDTYQECIANFPSASDAGFTLLNTPGSSPIVSVPMTDLIPESLNELESWIKTRIK